MDRLTPQLSGLHVAIILDGNGRWAAQRGKARAAGYRAGADAVRRTIEVAPCVGIGTLTLYAFSSDNWERPAHEVSMLLRLFQNFLQENAEDWVALGVRLRVIGRRDRLPAGLQAVIAAAEAATAEATTAEGETLHVRLAIDYSARDAILRAACRFYTATEISREAFSRLLDGLSADGAPAPDVDLLIRTGGEQRLSDFLLWECAYAELYFTSRLWPDFDSADLAVAVAEFHRRERRFGRLPTAAAG